jgi:hypothetical protein
MTTQRWKHAPAGSHWGEFGPDDQRGRMNLVDRAKVLQGVAEVREGLTFCLSLPLDVPGGMALNPRRLPPQRFSTLRDGKSAGQQGFCWSYASEDEARSDVVCDDVLLMNTQYSTQWDSFAHMGSRFDADGDGVAEAEQVLRGPVGSSITNLAFDGPDRKTLYCTESSSGSILRIGMDTAGMALHGLA